MRDAQRNATAILILLMFKYAVHVVTYIFFIETFIIFFMVDAFFAIAFFMVDLAIFFIIAL